MPRKVAPHAGSSWLFAGGVLSLIAVALHIGVIAGGPEWYRFFGAGEEMAQAAQRGALMPTLVTLAIASLLAVWSLFAFSGAGHIRRFPLLRTALIAIAAIYLARGLLLVPLLAIRPDLVGPFEVWSSLIVLAYGLAYAVGTVRGWRALKPAAAATLVTE